MKKKLFLLLLTLTIVSSLVAGTMATYTKTLEPLKGSATAKQFYIGSTETAFPKIKLAPTENAEWSFDVVNYKGVDVTEVDMDMDITVNVTDKEGFQAIDGLLVGLYENNVQLGNTVIKKGTAVVNIEKAFLANVQSSRSFTLKILWKNGIVSDAIDTYNADIFSTTKIAVTVTGTQCLHKSTEIKNGYYDILYPATVLKLRTFQASRSNSRMELGTFKTLENITKATTSGYSKWDITGNVTHVVIKYDGKGTLTATAPMSNGTQTLTLTNVVVDEIPDTLQIGGKYSTLSSVEEFKLTNFNLNGNTDYASQDIKPAIANQYYNWCIENFKPNADGSFEVSFDMISKGDFLGGNEGDKFYITIGKRHGVLKGE